MARTERIPHNHVFQLDLKEARHADCPACGSIRWAVMRLDPRALPVRFGEYTGYGQYFPSSF